MIVSTLIRIEAKDLEKDLVALGKTKTALKEDRALAVVVRAARPLMHEIGYDSIVGFMMLYDVIWYIYHSFSFDHYFDDEGLHSELYNVTTGTRQRICIG